MDGGMFDGIGLEPIGDGWLLLIPLALIILFFLTPDRGDDGPTNKLW